ncbi:hypothetical protein B0H11DRAFT_2133617 [Mycena galericulata]|nr:hypothetical protein B0H11DRAFT_2133617 [Mycena galericulata]
MSLPANVKLSVQGHSRPGDTSHSIPKQAMIVRMTAETLDALQATPHMEFSFGPQSGMYIGDKFFPMRPLKENSPHDLYLRASSATKPMAPLKLYANITGKFTVERDLIKVEDTIRSTTADAEKSRKERGITRLDAPLDLSSSQTKKKPQKRKDPPGRSPMFTKPIPQPRPSTSASTRVSSPLPPAPSTVAPSPLRTAVVKALALKERSVDELLRLIPSEHDVEKRKRKLLDLLNQLAEQPNATKSPTQWRLKPATWVEVRPYEWADLAEQERLAMARTARLTFSNLNIPESDPVWAHVRYRESAENPMVASGSATRLPTKTEAPKRGVSSKEAKEKRAKPKPDPKAEIFMRDESRPVPRASISSSKGKEVDDGPSPSAQRVAAARKVPGSGFKMTKVPSPDTPTPPTPPVPATNSAPPRAGPRDVRMKDREPPRASLPAKPAPPIAPPLQEKKAPPRIKKVKETAPAPEKEREPASESAGNDLLKRKKPSQDMDDPDVLPGSKRRRTEGIVPGTVPRHLSLPTKPETNLTSTSRSLPSKATKKELSPLPPTARQPQKSKNEGSSVPPPPRSSLQARPASGSTSSNQTQAESHSSSKGSSQTQRSNSSTKRRERRSPIYTSSEDEGEIRTSSRHEPAPLPTPPATTVHRSRGQPSSAAPRPLPTDRDGLRARYNATYLKYLQSYQQLFAQQSKLESLLSGRDGSTISDSDGDVEVLSTEDTIKLKADHKRWERELENIRGIFATPERSESKSD